MNDEQAKLYRMKADVVRAVAHPIRLAIVDVLDDDGEVCVCDIAERVGAERSNVSRHLSVMVNAGVLESRKDGLMVMYRLRTPCIRQFIGCIETMLKNRLEETAACLRTL